MSFLQELRDDIGRTGETLAEGWRALMGVARSALTYFSPAAKDPSVDGRGGAADTVRWGLLAADVADTGKTFVVTLEVPGLEQDDLDIQIDGHRLTVRGTKSFAHEETIDTWHYRERAFGSFQRRFTLPADVEADKTRARLHGGVLTIRLPKRSPSRQQRIAIHH